MYIEKLKRNVSVTLELNIFINMHPLCTWPFVPSYDRASTYISQKYKINSTSQIKEMIPPLSPKPHIKQSKLNSKLVS